MIPSTPLSSPWSACQIARGERTNTQRTHPVPHLDSALFSLSPLLVDEIASINHPLYSSLPPSFLAPRPLPASQPEKERPSARKEQTNESRVERAREDEGHKGQTGQIQHVLPRSYHASQSLNNPIRQHCVLTPSLPPFVLSLHSTVMPMQPVSFYPLRNNLRLRLLYSTGMIWWITALPHAYHHAPPVVLWCATERLPHENAVRGCRGDV